jgi:hypothetical protein
MGVEWGPLQGFVDNIGNVASNRFGKGSGAGSPATSSGFNANQVRAAAQPRPPQQRSTGIREAQQALGQFRGALASRKDLQQAELAAYLEALAAGAGGADPGGSGPSYAAPAPLRLPRMAMPSPESLAAQLYAAVGAATSPYQQAIGQLAGQQATAQTGIKQADQTAGESMNQATRDWRAATGQISGQIADVYRTALSSLAGFVGGNNAAMMNAGFAPSDTGGTAAMGRLAGLGASAQEASLARRDMGEQAVRGDRAARDQITQAGNQSMLSSYAQVLGGLNLQKAAAEAAARAEQVNREFALRQEVDRINFDAASQEAAANR